MNATSGRTLVDKTPAEARVLIENMSINLQQFTTRNNSTMMPTKEVNGIPTSQKKLGIMLDDITTILKRLTTGQTTIVCGICTSTEHPPQMCVLDCKRILLSIPLKHK